MDKNGIRVLFKEIAKEVIRPVRPEEEARIASAMTFFREADRLLDGIQPLVDQAQALWTRGYDALQETEHRVGDLTPFLSAETTLRYIRGQQLMLPPINVKSPFEEDLSSVTSLDPDERALETGVQFRAAAIQFLRQNLEHGIFNSHRDFSSLAGTLMYLTDLYPLAVHRASLFLAGSFVKNILLWGSTTLKPDTIDAAASDAIAAWDRQVATNPPDAAALAEAATMTTEVLEKLNAEEAP